MNDNELAVVPVRPTPPSLAGVCLILIFFFLLLQASQPANEPIQRSGIYPRKVGTYTVVLRNERDEAPHNHS
jgi:hypothetical protein